VELFVPIEMKIDNEDFNFLQMVKSRCFGKRGTKREIITNVWRISVNIWRNEKARINHRFMESKSMNLVTVLGNQISSLQMIITK
jgi:hypothetical protein